MVSRYYGPNEDLGLANFLDAFEGALLVWLARSLLPRHGWAPDPPMVGIRSPIGLVVESCTSHPGVLTSIPKREEPGKTGAPCVKVPGSSRVPSSTQASARRLS